MAFKNQYTRYFIKMTKEECGGVTSLPDDSKIVCKSAGDYIKTCQLSLQLPDLTSLGTSKADLDGALSVLAGVTSTQGKQSFQLYSTKSKEAEEQMKQVDITAEALKSEYLKEKKDIMTIIKGILTRVAGMKPEQQASMSEDDFIKSQFESETKKRGGIELQIKKSSGDTTRLQALLARLHKDVYEVIPAANRANAPAPVDSKTQQARRSS